MKANSGTLRATSEFRPHKRQVNNYPDFKQEASTRPSKSKAHKPGSLLGYDEHLILSVTQKVGGLHFPGPLKKTNHSPGLIQSAQ